MNNIIRDHLKAHFDDPKKSKLEPVISKCRRVDTPITKDEVAKSIHKIRNNRDSEYDEIPPELLKYAPPELRDPIYRLTTFLESAKNISKLVMGC